VQVERGFVVTLRDGLQIWEVPLREAAEAFLGLKRVYEFVRRFKEASGGVAF